ncbi:sensor histidine kinase [Alkalibacterium olivapovliticus]|uniref:Two-component system sensor histidine kinase YesM n=1 Tax=Alkalibacterium olivapovliticus TaxID=99907 RepID=A0A2T0W5J3_9LACT|nr:histidine kinase [Alkalibacterium olivapovliticus]PRY81357.1 two-component system sensor histidine kinase YesM [Alkalibacterium olivapovliticus]
MKKRVNRKPYISIKQKLLGSYFIILIIPILLVGVYLTLSIRNNLISNKLEEIESNNERIRSDYVAALSSITRVSDWIYQDEDLATLVTTQYDNPFDVYQAYSQYQMFEDYLRYYDEIEYIRFFVDNPTLTSTTGIYHASEAIQEQQWYRDGRDRNGRIAWEVITDHITQSTHLNLVRSVYSNYEFIGVVAIAVSREAIDNILDDSASSVFITLDNQTPLFSFPQHQNIYDAYAEYRPVLETVRTEEGNYNTVDSDSFNTDFTLNIRDVTIPKTLNSTMQVIGVVPTDSILEDVNRDLRVAYIIIISVLSISILMLVVFIKTFNSRIIKLKDAMSKVANGEFSIERSIKGNDELSDVYTHLVHTSSSIEGLMAINYEHAVKEKNWQLQLKDTQFKMLASQINPHFLYNTLEMIRMKALKNQDREVAEIITLLSRLMRKSLETKEKETSLDEELQFTEMYLHIQKLRFGDHIDYSINNHTSGRYLIIPLIIQPLVENSFIHGIEPMIGKGNIDITLTEDLDTLKIVIKDNGLGISQKKLLEIKQVLASEEESAHLGIRNVQQRIKVFYGEAYGLEIMSEEGKGTEITITVPKVTYDRESDETCIL